ncbi:MAG TPA: hypothetical protein VH255_00085 [Verrucomicrobiae bacterium]|nr:hypothetical protein [Verrucomicrobiae bacterium]
MTEISKILQQIADNTSHDSSTWIAVIAGLGLLGTALTALFGYLMVTKAQRTEERRLRSTLIVNERMSWLQEVRKKLAHLYALMDAHCHLLKETVPASEKVEHLKSLTSHFNEINEQTHLLNLMLNPKKQQQAQLKSALKASISFMDDCTTSAKSGTVTIDAKRYVEIRDSAFEAVTSIGAETWELVKELK